MQAVLEGLRIKHLDVHLQAGHDPDLHEGRSDTKSDNNLPVPGSVLRELQVPAHLILGQTRIDAVIPDGHKGKTAPGQETVATRMTSGGSPAGTWVSGLALSSICLPEV